MLLIAVNTLYIYTPWSAIHYNIYGRNWGLFDIIGCTVAAILFMFYISQFTKDRRALALKDPAKPWHP